MRKGKIRSSTKAPKVAYIDLSFSYRVKDEWWCKPIKWLDKPFLTPLLETKLLRSYLDECIVVDTSKLSRAIQKLPKYTLVFTTTEGGTVNKYVRDFCSSRFKVRAEILSIVQIDKHLLAERASMFVTNTSKRNRPGYIDVQDLIRR